MQLPTFKYHSDQLKTGRIVASEQGCALCGQARGFIYQAGMYGEREPEPVCPWCIADGSAHEKFGVEFVDRDFVGGGEWESVPVEIVNKLAFTTPGFSGWQQERWFTHCGDAAQFLGPMGKEQLQTEGPEAIEVVRLESGYSGNDWD